jgi:hypothetical protein
MRHQRFSLYALMVALMCSSGQANADEFTLINREGQEETFEAELVGSDKDWHALALANGQYRLVPQAAVRQRVAKDGPAPVSAKQVALELQKEYGADLFRFDVLDTYVVGLVLSTPLPKTSEGRIKRVLDKATQFMKQVERAFGTFLKEAKIESFKPKYPQVMLIFETDLEFDAYTEKITQQRGLQASMIAGFYSGLTNHLAIRLEECSNFDTPFHEAIHQQVYNRGLLQRLAPVPQWFDEGIATGFEASNGKILAQPTKVSPRYGRQALRTNHLSWEEMHTDDALFRSPDAVSEAYGQAWGLHWLLVTKYKTEYHSYLRTLHSKSAMAEDSPAERQADFAAAFKKPLRELEKEFPAALELAARKQNVPVEPAKPPGISVTESNLGKVTMSAVKFNGVLRVEGALINMSPLRPMSFVVATTFGDGTYAYWFHDKVDMNKTVSLPPQIPVNQRSDANLNYPANAFRVEVLSAPSDHPIAEEWRTKTGAPTLPKRRGARTSKKADGN